MRYATLFVLALLFAGCEKKVPYVQQVYYKWQDPPTKGQLFNALNATVWFVGDRDTIESGKLVSLATHWSEEIALDTTDSITAPPIIWRTVYRPGGVRVNLYCPDFYFTRREADSALCAQLQARIDSLGCNRVTKRIDSIRTYIRFATPEEADSIRQARLDSLECAR